MSAAVTLGARTGVVHLSHGGHLAFEDRGPADAPAVVVLGGISAGRHLASSPDHPTPGWWEDQVGPGRALDPERLRILSLDYLGGAGASARTAQAEGEPPTSVSTAVQADVVAELCDALGLPRLHAVVGASYGGMVALAFAQRHAQRVGRLAVLCAAHAPHPMATALRSLQRRVVRLARDAGVVHRGLRLARGLAMTTYRTPEEFQQRFQGPPRWTPDGVRFPVDGYLDARGEAFAGSFDADAFLTLSESLDLHRVDPAAVSTPTWVLASRSDLLVPLWQVRELVASLGGPVRCTELPSRFGHDAFLKETGPVGRFLHRAVRGPWPADTAHQGGNP